MGTDEPSSRHGRLQTRRARASGSCRWSRRSPRQVYRDADCESDFVSDFRGCDSGPNRHRGDHVVPACVADPGRQSYSAQIATWSGPEPARAMNAVGMSQTPASTLKPASASISHSHEDARRSSKPSSGLAWMRWLRVDQRASCGVQFFSCRRFQVHRDPPLAPLQCWPEMLSSAQQSRKQYGAEPSAGDPRRRIVFLGQSTTRRSSRSPTSTIFRPTFRRSNMRSAPLPRCFRLRASIRWLPRWTAKSPAATSWTSATRSPASVPSASTHRHRITVSGAA